MLNVVKPQRQESIYLQTLLHCLYSHIMLHEYFTLVDWNGAISFFSSSSVCVLSERRIDGSGNLATWISDSQAWCDWQDVLQKLEMCNDTFGSVCMTCCCWCCCRKYWIWTLLQQCGHVCDVWCRQQLETGERQPHNHSQTDCPLTPL